MCGLGWRPLGNGCLSSRCWWACSAAPPLIACMRSRPNMRPKTGDERIKIKIKIKITRGVPQQN